MRTKRISAWTSSREKEYKTRLSSFQNLFAQKSYILYLSQPRCRWTYCIMGPKSLASYLEGFVCLKHLFCVCGERSEEFFFFFTAGEAAADGAHSLIKINICCWEKTALMETRCVPLQTKETWAKRHRVQSVVLTFRRKTSDVLMLSQVKSRSN